MSIYDASVKYREAGVPLIVIAGKEYGSGSSRDWAAKGPKLLGVRAVIAESYERIHRSNLVGMGILPLEFKPGENRETLGLTGKEMFEITRVTSLSPRSEIAVSTKMMMEVGRSLRSWRASIRRRGNVLQERRHSDLRIEADDLGKRRKRQNPVLKMAPEFRGHFLLRN